MVNKLGIGLPLGLAGATIGFGQLGSAFESDALTSAGETTGKFIAPAVAVSAGGFLVNQLRDFKNVKDDNICPTPGMKIRSEGRGRGLAIGKGRGPIGRHRTNEREVGKWKNFNSMI
jgi:hypothetical protein